MEGNRSRGVRRVVGRHPLLPVDFGLQAGAGSMIPDVTDEELEVLEVLWEEIDGDEG